MAERLRNTESPFGKEWIMYGKYPGLKTEGLRNLQKPNVGVTVLPGISIGASYYHEFLEQGLSGELPHDLSLINKHILKMMPVSKPVAIRSSGADEAGGTGENKSVFISPTGNVKEDLQRLENAEKSVYASYHKEGESKGMGILIQPVVGNKFGDYFMPVLAGVYTTENGEPLLRLVIGLGTKAVALDEALVFKGDDISLDNIEKGLCTLRKADAIDLQTGQVVQIDISQNIMDAAYEQAGKIEVLKKSWGTPSVGGNQYYWEFAIDSSDNPPFVVQSNTGQFSEQKSIALAEPEGKILCEGLDVMNVGIKIGRGVFVVGEHVLDPNDFSIVASINSGFRDHLLILRDVAFSGVAGHRLIGFEHFNNTAGVVELQFKRPRDPLDRFSITLDHSGGKGGSHFSEICKRKDILFIGVPVGEEGLRSKLIMGEPTKRYGRSIEYWDVPFKMTNTVSGGRVEILDSVAETNPLAEQLDKWQGDLYDMASAVSRNAASDEERKLSDSLYSVFSCFCNAEESLSQTSDPFSFMGKMDQKDIPGLREDIQSVLLFVGMVEDCDPSNYSKYFGFNGIEPLEEFLKQLYGKLNEARK